MPDPARPRLHAYLLPNWDGVHCCMVAAPNQKQAARAMRSSLGGFRRYGGQRVTDPETVTLAMSDPGAVWIRRITVGGPAEPWRKYLSSAEDAARAV